MTSIKTFIINKMIVINKQEISILWILKDQNLQPVSYNAMLECRNPLLQHRLYTGVY